MDSVRGNVGSVKAKIGRVKKIGRYKKNRES